MVRIYGQDDLPDLNRSLRNVRLPTFTHFQKWIPWTDPKSRKKTWYEITDQWFLPRSDIRRSKMIYAIQKFATEEGVRIRIAYYKVGKRPKAKGRWVSGQYPPWYRPKDLTNLAPLFKKLRRIRGRFA